MSKDLKSYCIESEEVYRCFTYIDATSPEEALEKFKSFEFDHHEPHEWSDTYKMPTIKDVEEN